MTEYQESCAAKFVLEMAQDYAINIVDDVQDHAAATAAILVRALELATPDLSPQRRASLFLQEEE